jgi:hypothetical protein
LACSRDHALCGLIEQTRSGQALLTRAGGRWTSTDAPRPPSGLPTSFASISCTDVGQCVAVGTETGADVALVASYTDGVWTAEDLGVPPFARGSDATATLTMVSCFDTTCLAAGRWTSLTSSAVAQDTFLALRRTG